MLCNAWNRRDKYRFANEIRCASLRYLPMATDFPVNSKLRSADLLLQIRRRFASSCSAPPSIPTQLKNKDRSMAAKKKAKKVAKKATKKAAPKAGKKTAKK